MLLTIGLIMAIISTYTEIKLVHGSKTIDRLYTHGIGNIEGVWFNTAGSFLLSYLIGMMFGAEGVTVMLAGALSTGLSQIYFSIEKWAEDNGYSMTEVKERFLNTIQKSKDSKDALVKTYQDFKQPIQDIGRVLLVILRIITLPFILLRKGSVAYTEYKTKGVSHV